MDDSESDQDDADDGGEHVPEETDEEEDVLDEEEMRVVDDLDDRAPAQLIVGLKVKNKDKLAGATLTPSPESKDVPVRSDEDASPPKPTATTPAAAPLEGRTPEPEMTVAAINRPDSKVTPLAFRGSPEKTLAALGDVPTGSKE